MQTKYLPQNNFTKKGSKMKKALLLLLFFIFITVPAVVNAQTFEEIQKEAYPEYKYVQDNSEQAQLLRALTEAKKNGNENLFKETLHKLNSKFSGNGTVINNPPLPENRNYFLPVENMRQEEVFAPDWANGENLIFGRSVASASPGNPNMYNRMIRIQSDSMGVMFAGFLNSTKDTLFYYKSTNRGASWTMIKALYSGSSIIYYSFDFAVGDTTGGFKIGMVVSLAPSATPYQGTIYYADMMADGSAFTPTVVESPSAGRGLIGPVICTDAYFYNALNTYWYIAYSNCDATSGVTSHVPVAYTPDWGSSWIRDTARNSYNDYELDIDYNFFSDSIYVLMTNNLTSTNENIRLRYISLADWGTTVAWKQFNPASTSIPEYNGSFEVNHNTNTAVVSYTVTESLDQNIRYSYSLNGTNTNWVTDNVLSALPNAETRSTLYSLTQQSGSFRISYISSGANYDTVVYMNTFSISTGFAARTIVSRVHPSTGVYAPAITAYMFNGVSAGAGIIFAGFGPSNIWFNGSDITTEIKNISSDIPEEFNLFQNYPNPFNPVTNIKFNVKGNGSIPVTLKIFDMLGKEISTLVNQSLASGVYEVQFDASKLSSGVYFYTLSSGDFKDTKKMIIMK